MIKKITIALAIPIMLLQSCLGDPDPIEQSIDTYHYYYNYLLETYDLQWEVDDVTVGTGHSYGVPAQAIVSLSEEEEEVLIRARNSENSQLIDSLSHIMYEYGSFMIALLGDEEEPHLLCEAMNTRMPSFGMVKFRFLHATEALGQVDIYIGGDQEEHLALSAMDYTDVSEYKEVAEEEIWDAVIVTPANTLPADSIILEYNANSIFQVGGIYLCILEHTSSSAESPIQIQVDDQPVYY